jgi:hypothetical protein
MKYYFILKSGLRMRIMQTLHGYARTRVLYRLTTKLWLSWWRFNPHNNDSSISKQHVWPKDLRFLPTTVYFFFFLFSFLLINFSASSTHFQSSTSICFSFKFVLYFFFLFILFWIARGIGVFFQFHPHLIFFTCQIRSSFSMFFKSFS